MLLLDDILLFPATGIMWIFREVHNAAQEELAREADVVTAELTELYMKLESGKITEEEFDVREKVLLDRLDRIEAVETDPEQRKTAERKSRKRTKGEKTYAGSFAP